MNSKLHESFISQNLPSLAYLLQQSLLHLPQSTISWGPSVQMYDPMSDILIQTITTWIAITKMTCDVITDYTNILPLGYGLAKQKYLTPFCIIY